VTYLVSLMNQRAEIDDIVAMRDRYARRGYNRIETVN